MKKLLVYLKDYKKETVLAPLFKMLEASFELLIPIVVKLIVDVGIANRDTGYVGRMCFVMILLGVIGLVCSITAQYFSAKAAVGFATKLRHTLFAHMQKFSFSQMDKMGTASMITRMTSDVNQVQNGVNMVLRLFLRSPFIVFGAMVMAFTVDVKAALVFVIVIPLLSVVVFGIMLITIPLYKKVQAGLDKVLGITRGNLTGVRVLRAFHKEEEEKEEFDAGNEKLTVMQMFVGRISAIMNPVTYIIVNGATIALLWIGAVRVDSGILTKGDVIALVNYMSQILVELVKLANLIITVNKAIACGNRIGSVLEIEAGLTEGAIDSGAESGENAGNVEEALQDGREGIDGGQQVPVVEFDHVSLTYPGAGAESLTDVHFTAKKGETIGIIGGTGSGKSSLVNLIPRFYEATAGSVKIDGVPVAEYSLKALRAKIGVVPQKAVLFKGTIRENLLMGREVSADALEGEENALKAREAEDALLREALEISQSAEFVDSKPEGLETQISQGGKNLSGGQKQRLTIARALVKQPEILILDDSASALDYATDLKLRRAIHGMKKAPVVFIVSQRASSILYADKIIVLDDGEVAGMGTHEELLGGCEVYQEIYYSQYPDKRGEVTA
ncbi:MAG: ABC transporter ATP-binding protein [Lachnospiraceae bacterium]|nr:ABC transporter ATP-binding protein [Lachnospiraceae bacterium]